MISASPLSSAPVTGLRVLYVEDEPITLGIMHKYLTRHGIEVYTANNGKAGLEAFRQYRPQVVISDIRMPEMDGITMCREIRALDPDVYLIMATAYNESELLMESIDFGAVKYILKPVDPNNLIRTLQSVSALIDKQQRLASQLQAMDQSIHESKRDAEKLQSFVSRAMNLDGQTDMQNVRHLFKPLGDVGGDFFCVEQSGDSLYAIVADGTGHGPSAIVPALQVPHLFRELAQKGYSLLTIADDINRFLRKQHLTDHFLATTLIRMNFREGDIEVINCGNPAALLLDQQGALLHRFDSRSVALGLLDTGELGLDAQRFKCEQPARLYVFTDGLPDAMNPMHAPGFDLVAMFTGTPADGIFDHLKQQLESSDPAVAQRDDIALLELNFSAAPPVTSLPPPASSVAPVAPVPGMLSENDERLNKMSVLFVEDDDDAFDYMSRYLQRRVGILHTARDGATGLEKFTKHRPQLVISDIRMPLMSGFSMAEAIRQIDKQVPIILVSASMEPDRIESMLELNINKFLAKPVDMDRLRHAILESVSQFDQAFDIKLSASVFMTTPLAIIITNPGNEIVAANPAFSQITGYTTDEVLGRNPSLLSSGKHDNKFYSEMWSAINETGHWSGEIWNRRKDGELFLEWITINAVKNDTGEVSNYVSIFADVTERSSASARLHHLAQHDSLTGLPNRILFIDRARQALRTAQRDQTMVAVMVLDIDHFKAINDTMGYGAGDELLVTMASCLRKCVREADTVSRLGADEFAILLTNAGSRDTVNQLAGRILDSVRSARPLAGTDIQIAISMGISVFPGDGDEAEALMKHAESALAASKGEGRDQYSFFDVQQNEKMRRLLAIQQGIRMALGNGEFSMLYQPKCSVEQWRIVGAEALIRWESPALGSVAPAEFIPIAEESGLIVEIGEWVIDTVCRQLAEWNARQVPLVPVSINISPRHFQRGNLIASLTQALKQHGLDAELLQIELTEGVVMKDSETTMEMLLELRRLGFKVSIDDFGTGYSSLSYLRRLPIDELKIDRTFIKEIGPNARNGDMRQITAIPLSIIQLARNLNLQVIAEGVETVAQQSFLARNGCDVMQGYLFYIPLAPEAFVAALKASCCPPPAAS